MTIRPRFSMIAQALTQCKETEGERENENEYMEITQLLRHLLIADN